MSAGAQDPYVAMRDGLAEELEAVAQASLARLRMLPSTSAAETFRRHQTRAEAFRRLAEQIRELRQ